MEHAEVPLLNESQVDSTTLDQIRAARTRLGTEGRTARIRGPSRAPRFLLGLCDLTDLVEP